MTEYDSASSGEWSSSSFPRERPEFAHRDWLEQQHQRYTRAATRWFNVR